MAITFERRDGRLTVNEYRVIVTVGGRSATGAWCYTKRDARQEAEALRASLFDADEAERTLASESHRRMRHVRTMLDVDRRVRPSA